MSSQSICESKVLNEPVAEAVWILGWSHDSGRVDLCDLLGFSARVRSSAQSLFGPPPLSLLVASVAAPFQSSSLPRPYRSQSGGTEQSERVSRQAFLSLPLGRSALPSIAASCVCVGINWDCVFDQNLLYPIIPIQKEVIARGGKGRRCLTAIRPDFVVAIALSPRVCLSARAIRLEDQVTPRIDQPHSAVDEVGSSRLLVVRIASQGNLPSLGRSRIPEFNQARRVPFVVSPVSRPTLERDSRPKTRRNMGEVPWRPVHDGMRLLLRRALTDPVKA